jgi:hypothetical protein
MSNHMLKYFVASHSLGVSLCAECDTTRCALKQSTIEQKEPRRGEARIEAVRDEARGEVRVRWE